MDGNNIQIGDVPALLFLPGPMPDGTVIPSKNILVVQLPSLYVFARDLVVADQQIRQAEENSKAVNQMLRALLQFKTGNGEKAYNELEEQWRIDSVKPYDEREEQDNNEDKE